MGKLYQYTTVAHDGRPQHGLVYGGNPQEAQRQLTDRFLLLTEVSPWSLRTGLRFFSTSSRKPSSDLLIPFFNGLRLMIQEGVPLWEAIQELTHLTVYSPTHAAYMRYIEAQLKEGVSIAKAFQVPLFPAWIPLLLDLGEKTSRLSEVIHHIEHLLELKQRVTVQARKMLSYPFFLLVFLMGGGILFSLFDPNLSLLGDPEILSPQQTKAPLNLLIGSIVFLLCAGILAGTLGKLFFPQLKQYLHKILLHFPGLHSFETHRQTSLWSFALALALESYLPLHEALDLSKHFVTNLELRKNLDQVSKQLLEGQPLSEGMKHTSFPPTVHRLCRMGESSGSLSQILFLIHKLCDSTVDRWVDGAFRLLAPTLTLLSGAVLLLMGWRFLLPLYEMMIEMGRQMP